MYLASAYVIWIIAEATHLSDSIRSHVCHLSVSIVPWNGFFHADVSSLNDSIGNIVGVADVTSGELF